MTSDDAGFLFGSELKTYFIGVPPALLIEAQKRIQFNSNIIGRSTILTTLLHNLHAAYPIRKIANILSAYFGFLIAKNLDWVTIQTLDQIVMGALVQDIGLTSAAEKLPGISFENLEKEHHVIYKNHPRDGLILLQDIENISERVRQVVYQHHELSNSTGFPNGIIGSRIYPPAKILSLASSFCDEMVRKPNERPSNILRSFASNRDMIVCFDAECVRALIKVFIKDKK